MSTSISSRLEDPRGNAFATYSRDLRFELARAFRADLPLYLFIVAYTLTGLAFLNFAGASDRAAYANYFVKWMALFGLMLPIISLSLDYGLLVHRFDAKRRLAARRLFSPRRIGHFFSGIVLLLSMIAFQGTFTSVKTALAVYHDGFPYDTIQANLDAALHFGVDPWRWLYAVGRHDFVRAVVEWNYNMLWFFICFGALFFIVTSSRTAAIRNRYVMSYMLVWALVGNVLAGVFLSAGPAFYGLVTGDTLRFAAQLDFLSQSITSAHSAASYHQYLWTAYESGQPGFGVGISAFPSVHVALITLNAMFLFEHSRKLGTIAFVYVAFIVASSVYLAWHYAIDGYAAIAVTAVIYLVLRKLMPDRQRFVGGAPSPASYERSPSIGRLSSR